LLNERWVCRGKAKSAYPVGGGGNHGAKSPYRFHLPIQPRIEPRRREGREGREGEAVRSEDFRPSIFKE